MDKEERRNSAALLALLLDVPGIGPARANHLLDEYGTPRGALDGLRRESKSGRVQDFLESASFGHYKQAVIATYDLGGRVVLDGDPDYPASLASWDARPPILYVKGSLGGLSRRALALVGRVDPSEQGQAAARSLAEKCVAADIVVVSGLAKGIDAASHRGALDGGGRTFAVLGHGLDFAYPAENAELYEEIPRKGALISQFRTGVGPQRWTFPMRNELMCTLALGTVIVEGAERCGSNIQADFSMKHGRPVFVLSKNLRQAAPWAERHIANGAHVVRYFEDLENVVSRTESEPGLGSEPSQPDLFRIHDEALLGHRPQTVLFDLDGVIADSRMACAIALAEVASGTVGMPVAAEDLLPYVAGSPVKALSTVGVADSYKVYRANYDPAFVRAAEHLSLYDEVVDVLGDLRDRGVHIGVITSQTRRRANLMLPERVQGLLDVFYTYADYGGDKAKGIMMALDQLGVEREQALFVGDSKSDVVAARTAGVRSLAVGWGFTNEDQLISSGPDYFVPKPGELGASLNEILD